MKRFIQIICVFLCSAILFCGCNFTLGGGNVSNGYAVNNWQLSGGTTITGIENISTDGLKVSFTKEQGEQDGELTSQVGISIVKNHYVNLSLSATYPLCIQVACVLLNLNNATDELQLNGTILVQPTQSSYTLLINGFSDDHKILKQLTVCPSFGTESGSGQLSIHKAVVDETFTNNSSIIVMQKVEKAPDDSGNNDNSGNNGGGEVIQNPTYLWEKYNQYFPIGYAIGAENIDKYKGTLDKHFNSFTCENEMKMYAIAPNSSTQENYAAADNMLNYVRSQGKICRGHALVWHVGAPQWITSITDKQTLLREIENYVTRVVKHFGDKVYCWDVCNEVIGDDNQYRPSFYSVAGIDYIKTAFRAARAANPNIKLFYNDYNMDKPQKRAKVMEMLRELIRDGVPIDGVGMQAHYDLKYTTVAGVEQAIKDFASLGLEVQITELDIKNYGNTGTAKQAQLYGDLFALFRRYQGTITGVTLWNVADDYSWLDGDQFSHFGTGKSYPTLFDVNHNKKDAFYKVFDF